MLVLKYLNSSVSQGAYCMLKLEIFLICLKIVIFCMLASAMELFSSPCKIPVYATL